MPQSPVLTTKAMCAAVLPAAAAACDHRIARRPACSPAVPCDVIAGVRGALLDPLVTDASIHGSSDRPAAAPRHG